MNVNISKLISSGLGVILSAFFGIALSKLISIQSGPEALGEFGIYRQFIQVVIVFLSFGNGFSLIEGLAKTTQVEKFLKQSLHYYLGVTLFISILIFVFNKSLALFILDDLSKSELLRFSPIIFICATIYLYYRFALSGIKEVFRSSLAQAFPFFFMFLFYFVEKRVHFLFIYSYGASVLLSALVSQKKIQFFFSNFFQFERNIFFEKTSISTLITGVTGFGTLLVIKVLVNRNLGIESTGMMEASLNLAIYASMVFLNGFSIYYLPTLSTNPEDYTFMRRYLVLIATLSGITTIILSVGSQYIIPLFYSHEFDESITLLKWFALGEFIKCMNWFFIFTFIAISHKKLYTLIDVFSNLCFVAVTYYFLSNNYNLKGVGYSYVIFQFIYLILSTTLFPRKEEFGHKYLILPIILSLVFILISIYIL